MSITGFGQRDNPINLFQLTFGKQDVQTFAELRPGQTNVLCSAAAVPLAAPGQTVDNLVRARSRSKRSQPCGS